MSSPTQFDERLRASIVYVTLGCMVVTVVGAIGGLLVGALSVAALGTTSGAATGGGLCAFLYYFYKILQTALAPAARKRR